MASLPQFPAENGRLLIHEHTHKENECYFSFSLCHFTNYQGTAYSDSDDYHLSKFIELTMRVVCSGNEPYNNKNILFIKAKYVDYISMPKTLHVSSRALKIQQDTLIDNSWHVVSWHVCISDIPIVDITFSIKDSYIANTFRALHEDSNLTDFELVGEGGSVSVHKAILAAISPVLKAMLAVGGEWQEVKQSSVLVAGTTNISLMHLKDYIYLNKLPENVEQLLLLADYYQMQDLRSKCIIQLVCTLGPENLIERSKFAVNHGLNDLLLSMFKKVQEGNINLENN